MTPAALALWLCLAGAPAPFTWEVPEAIEDVPIGNTPSADGRPMRLRAVRSRWSAEKLRQKLGEDFLRAGFFIPPPRDQPQNLTLGYIAAVDGRRMISYSVLFQLNLDGTTTVILGEVDLEARVSAVPAAPVFPGALDVVASDVEAMRSVGYRAKARPEEVLAFYRDVLGRAGYQDAGRGTFERGAERTLVVTRPGKDGFLRVTVMTTLGGAPPAMGSPPSPSPSPPAADGKAAKPAR